MMLLKLNWKQLAIWPRPSCPELQSSSDTHQKLGNGTACFKKRLFRSRKFVSATGKTLSGGSGDLVPVAQIRNGFAFDQICSRRIATFRAKIASVIIVHQLDLDRSVRVDSKLRDMTSNLQIDERGQTNCRRESKAEPASVGRAKASGQNI
jgi:hypothetical protein